MHKIACSNPIQSEWDNNKIEIAINRWKQEHDENMNSPNKRVFDLLTWLYLFGRASRPPLMNLTVQLGLILFYIVSPMGAKYLSFLLGGDLNGMKESCSDLVQLE